MHDLPASDIQLSAFYGEQVDSVDTSAADKARNAIRVIPDHLFTPAHAAAILETLNAKLYSGTYKNHENVLSATEFMDDAITSLEQ